MCISVSLNKMRSLLYIGIVLCIPPAAKDLQGIETAVALTVEHDIPVIAELVEVNNRFTPKVATNTDTIAQIPNTNEALKNYVGVHVKNILRFQTGDIRIMNGKARVKGDNGEWVLFTGISSSERFSLNELKIISGKLMFWDYFDKKYVHRSRYVINDYIMTEAGLFYRLIVRADSFNNYNLAGIAVQKWLALPVDEIRIIEGKLCYQDFEGRNINNLLETDPEKQWKHYNGFSANGQFKIEGGVVKGLQVEQKGCVLLCRKPKTFWTRLSEHKVDYYTEIRRGLVMNWHMVGDSFDP